MMTCLEFRRALMADNVISEEMKEHASGCKACSAFAAQTKQQEASIARALMVEPPESLAAKILFRQRSNELQPNDIESLNLPVLSRLEDAMLVDVPQGLAARVIAAKRLKKLPVMSRARSRLPTLSCSNPDNSSNSLWRRVSQSQWPRCRYSA